MPNFDTGHLFLTFLTPIRLGATDDVTGKPVSFEQRLRIILALLPTALQSPATQRIGETSPFARNRQTHLCRFMVLDDVIYNGRNPRDAIETSISGGDPIFPQPVDKLTSSYLLFAADIDAVMDEGDDLPAALTPERQNLVRDAYLRRLWTTMEPELRSIYSNCWGFDEVTDADSFARYMARCQIETTMPFHDYWITPPELKNLPVNEMIVAVSVPVIITLLGLIVGWWGGWGIVGGLVATAAVVYALYRYVLANGQKPLPPERYGSLPSVLKSLYVQQNFADFVVDHQGASPEDLHRAFGEFLAQHRPDNRMAPSQAPGVISSRAAKGLVS
ncbi:MAG: hypothetical protein KDA73_01570 [Rhodobacteraceae bacterium]|nr:hypothetical protein [Paracoccaceae bacterium]